MLEGKLPNLGGAQAFDQAGGGQDSLRAVSWSDLVARLNAARELRAELGTGETAGGASFDPDSARHIAELAGSKQDINFDDLANGKAAGGKAHPNNTGAASDDPRK
jgi:hypothetical protein